MTDILKKRQTSYISWPRPFTYDPPTWWHHNPIHQQQLWLSRETSAAHKKKKKEEEKEMADSTSSCSDSSSSSSSSLREFTHSGRTHLYRSSFNTFHCHGDSEMNLMIDQCVGPISWSVSSAIDWSDSGVWSQCSQSLFHCVINL